MEEGEGERTAVQRRATPAMEAESRAWMVRCPNCGFERSVWDMGGVRYKAAGTSRNYMGCIKCGKRGWHKIYFKGGVPGVTQASAGSIVKLVLAIVGGTLLLMGLIIFALLELSKVL